MPDTPLDVSLQELLHQREWLARLARALVADPHTAEDVAQQTWLHALAQRTPLREGRAWLSTVLANVVRQRHRGEARRTRRERAVATEREAFPDPAAEANERFETQRIVAAAVQALDEPFRSTVLLHHFEGMTLAAIGKSQGMPAGTVRWRLFRAHELLREALAARLGRDEWRRGLALLCAPVRRSALLAPAAALLLAAGVATTAIVWAVSGGSHTPAPPRTEVAAAARDEARDDRRVDRELARGAVDQPAAEDAAATPKPSPAADQSAMVRARIAGNDGAPLAGATLRLSEIWLGGQKAPAGLVAMLVPTASAGADGRVTVALRAPGEMLALIGVRPREFVARATVVASGKGHADESVELHVANGDDRDLGTITLCSTATVGGRVIDADGRPVDDARVCVLRPPFPKFCDALAATQHAPDSKPATTVEAGSGVFELAGVRTGRAIVWASKSGFVSAWRLVDVTGRHTHCDDLVLRADTTPAPPPEQRKVYVVVVDEAHAPVPEARVSFRQRHALAHTSSGHLTVDANGRVELPSVGFGNASSDVVVDLELAATSARPTLGSVVVTRPVAVAGEIRIVLPPAVPFEVHARSSDGAPIAEFSIQWNADAPAFGQGFAAGTRGVAELAAPATAATFEVFAAGCAKQRVSFVPGATASPLVLTLAPQLGITGVVTAGGKPVVDARVSVLRCSKLLLLDGFRSDGERKGKWDALTGGDGRFRVDNVEPGVVRLQVRADGHATSLTELHDFDPANGWNDVAVELAQGGTIEGVVRDRTGAVVPRALVAIHDFHGDVRTVFADTAGRLRCEHLRAGGYEVRITNRALDGTWSWTCSLNDVDPVRTDCDVKDGETTRFDLIVDRCRIVGLLLPTGFDPHGWSATLMRAHDGLPTCTDVTLSRDGSFVLSSSSDGPHDLRLTAPGGPLGNVSVFVRLELVAGDNPVNVPLALAPFRARAAGSSGARDGSWAYLKQETATQRVLAYVRVDPSTLDFSAPLAPVGEVVLVEGPPTGGAREVGRFVIAPR